LASVNLGTRVDRRIRQCINTASMKSKINILILSSFLSVFALATCLATGKTPLALHTESTAQPQPNAPTPSPIAVKTSWIDEKASEILKKAQGLDEKVLRLALASYKEATDQSLANSHILSVVDFTKTSGQKRMWVLDLFQNTVLFHELVAHGKNSGDNTLATSFSNQVGSLQSSLGLYRTAESFYGLRAYSLTLHGLNKGINDNAYDRGVIMHGAHYVNEKLANEAGYVGRSHGCFSVRQDVTKKIIDTIKGGSLLYAYHPKLLELV
jgi:hypothetical protein